MSASNRAAGIASAIQAASMNRNSSPTHDLNSSTAASRRIPLQPLYNSTRARSFDSDESRNAPSPSILRPIPPRKRNLPPLPDLRFEQSYLRSIEGTNSWVRIGWITVRDQVLLPLLQGTLWTLLLSGWRYWHRGTPIRGQGVGTRMRRWWWKLNHWKAPEDTLRSNRPQF